MSIEFKLAKYTRCDVIAFSGLNLSGKRSIFQGYPGGNTRGKIASNEMRSVVFRAPYGTRFILCTLPTDNWESATWRCLNLTKDNSIAPEDGGFPGIRLPDLDLLNDPEAKRVMPGLMSSYPYVENFADGEGWTFGSSGSKELKANVRMIIVEKIKEGENENISEGEAVARAILTAAREAAPDAINALAEAAKKSLKEQRHRNSLQAWLDKK